MLSLFRLLGLFFRLVMLALTELAIVLSTILALINGLTHPLPDEESMLCLM